MEREGGDRVREVWRRYQRREQEGEEGKERSKGGGGRGN